MKENTKNITIEIRLLQRPDLVVVALQVGEACKICTKASETYLHLCAIKEPTRTKQFTMGICKSILKEILNRSLKAACMF